MPAKKVSLGHSTGLSTFRINEYGFPKIEKEVVSKATADRIMKKAKDLGIEEIICDPACNKKGRKDIADHLKKKHGQYGHPDQVKRLDLPSVQIGGYDQNSDYHVLCKLNFYCTTSVDHHLEHRYWPKRNQNWAKNFSSKTVYDQSGYL